MTPPLRRSIAGSEGTSLVEFALILPLFLLLLFGLVDFGRAYSISVTLTNAAREGARYGVTAPTDTNGITSRTQTTAGPYNDGNLTVSVSFPAPPAGSTCTAAGTSGCSVVVQTTYQFAFITPLVAVAKLISAGTLPSTMTLTSSADMRIE